MPHKRHGGGINLSSDFGIIECKKKVSIMLAAAQYRTIIIYV